MAPLWWMTSLLIIQGGSAINLSENVEEASKIYSVSPELPSWVTRIINFQCLNKGWVFCIIQIVTAQQQPQPQQ